MRHLRFSMAAALAALALAVGFGVACGGGGTQADPQHGLVLEGLVEAPLNLTLDDLRAMDKTTEYVELYCVDYPTVPVEKGEWAGVRLRLLLEQAGVSPQAVKVALYDDYGYSTDLTLRTAIGEDIILAYERDGVPLDETLRLVVPGRWGYKWISGVTHIELVDYGFMGVWETRGYSDEADITAEPSSPE